MFDLGLGDLHTLVTGASGGIGLATVDAFLSQDARVTAHYNSNASPLNEIVSRGKGRVCAVQADLGVEADVDRLYEEAREKQGGRAVEVLVGESRVASKPSSYSSSVDPSSPFTSQPRVHRPQRCAPDRYVSRAMEQDRSFVAFLLVVAPALS